MVCTQQEHTLTFTKGHVQEERPREERQGDKVRGLKGSQGATRRVCPTQQRWEGSRRDNSGKSFLRIPVPPKQVKEDPRQNSGFGHGKWGKNISLIMTTRDGQVLAWEGSEDGAGCDRPLRFSRQPFLPPSVLTPPPQASHTQAAIPAAPAPRAQRFPVPNHLPAALTPESFQVLQGPGTVNLLLHLFHTPSLPIPNLVTFPHHPVGIKNSHMIYSPLFQQKARA